MSRTRRFLPRLALSAAVAATLVVVTADSSRADDDLGEVDTARWSASFNDPQLNTGAKTVTNAATSGEGTFKFKPATDGLPDSRTLESVSASIVDPPEEPPCEVTLEADEPKRVDSLTMKQPYTLTSPCNQVVLLQLNGRSSSTLRPVDTTRLRAYVTFAVPATPVTDVSASVPDIDSREVTISWSKPDGSEMDTTYRVQRRAPDSDKWANIGDDLEMVDTVEETGVYKYRVVADRPEVDPVPSDVVEVYVGIEPPTTTTPDDGDDDDESTTTITQPGGNAPITRGGGSGGRGVSSHTTAVTAPNSPPTTIDTGFEETLDYHLDDIEPGELAAEGQSILNTEEATGVIGPGAVGASVLVMAGWAGHYLYFRRLAAQF